MTSTVVRRTLTRRPGADDGFAMLMVILLIMVCASVSVLMLGVVVAQVKPTVFEAKNTRTISAAEAGVDATLSQFRTATVVDAITHDVYGDPRLLPCTVGGAVGAGTSTLRYDVAIRYFSTSPANKTDAWRASNALTCVAGSGLTRAPNFALITSVGGDGAVDGYAASVGNRTLESVYTFQVSSSAINGGVIYSFGDAYCLQADGRTDGSPIHYVKAADCRVDNASRLWSYGKDYSLHLSVTDLPGSIPMCITGSGGDAALRVCLGTRYDQKFSWEGDATWQGQLSDNSNYASQYIGTGNSSFTGDLTGKILRVTGTTGNDVQWGSFDPDPRVGPGAADFSKHQVVNFLEYGRCFDVTNESVASTFMIVYPCKQDPSVAGTNLKWNHRWYYLEPTPLVGSTTPQRIKVTYNSTDYCLTTPAATGTYPTLTVCSSSTDQLWIRTAKADTYANSWTFTESSGSLRCIGLGDKYNGAWSKMTVGPCTGGPEQKWNAPPTALSASLDNFKELN